MYIYIYTMIADLYIHKHTVLKSASEASICRGGKSSAFALHAQCIRTRTCTSWMTPCQVSVYTYVCSENYCFF